MKVTVKAAGARLVIRDVLRRPLAEMEVGQVLAGLSRPCPDVIQVPPPHHTSRAVWSWSCNQLVCACLMPIALACDYAS